MSSPLGDLEQILLFAVVRLKNDASGAAIREEIKNRTGRSISPGAVYTVMARLEARGFVTSEIAGPAPVGGGRRKKFYRLAPDGADALARSYDQIASMASGVVPRLKRLAEQGDI